LPSQPAAQLARRDYHICRLHVSLRVAMSSGVSGEVIH